MDGGGRLAEPLTPARSRQRRRGVTVTPSRRVRARGWCRRAIAGALTSLLRATRLDRLVFRRRSPLRSRRVRRGIAVAALLVGAGLSYAAVRNGEADLTATLHHARDALANAAGFRIATVAITGNHQVSRADILASAGVTPRTSLLFFNVDAARAKLKTNPWIADATVLKLYPDRLQIGIKERRPFALWQLDRKVSVIAADGIVLEPYVPRRFTDLPFVVGRGAQSRAKAFLAMLARYPSIKKDVRASILVAERRWDLLLKSGLKVQLPEQHPRRALHRLVMLDRDKKILSRDILVVDLRLADRVAVRLSDDAFKAREQALKAAEKKAKRQGGDA